MSACHLLIWNSTLKSNIENLQKQLTWTIISVVRQSIRFTFHRKTNKLRARQLADFWRKRFAKNWEEGKYGGDEFCTLYPRDGVSREAAYSSSLCNTAQLRKLALLISARGCLGRSFRIPLLPPLAFAFPTHEGR